MNLPNVEQGEWGIRPVLFKNGIINIDSYTFFILVALFLGILIFYYEAHRNKRFNENAFYILIAALVGGSLGAKLPVWIANFQLLKENHFSLPLFLSGRTIVGGLIGGWLAVVLLKRRLGMNIKLGNEIAPALAIAIAVGRVGCFLRGCCYGIPGTTLGAVNFGDGIMRYPTQIYEALFGFSLFVFFQFKKRKVLLDGELFYSFLNYYFMFRFMIEFIRVHDRVLLGLSGFQIVSAIVLFYLNRGYFMKFLGGGNKHGERLLR